MVLRSSAQTCMVRVSRMAAEICVASGSAEPLTLHVVVIPCSEASFLDFDHLVICLCSFFLSLFTPSAILGALVDI